MPPTTIGPMKTMTRWLKTLDSNILYKETPSSFSSIDLTLQHLNHSQNFWLTNFSRRGCYKAG